MLTAERAFARHGFWEALAQDTGVTSKRWRNFFSGSQRATPDMVEALARKFPQFAFWLVTGITDAINGHVAPSTVETFPERPSTSYAEDSLYFCASLELHKRLIEGGVTPTDDASAIHAFDRTHAIPWRASELASTVESLVESDAYRELIRLWRDREDKRNERVELNERAAWRDRHRNFGPHGWEAPLGEREVFYRSRGKDSVFALLPRAVAETAKRFPKYKDFGQYREYAIAVMRSDRPDWSELDLSLVMDWLRCMEGPVAWQFVGWLLHQGLLPAGVIGLPFTDEDVKRFEAMARKHFGLGDDNQES